MSGWVEIILRAGLVIEQLGEPCASLELAEAEPVVADADCPAGSSGARKEARSIEN